jgi:hypothetical protein
LERFSGWRTHHAPASQHPARRKRRRATHAVDRTRGRLGGPRAARPSTGTPALARPYARTTASAAPHCAVAT